jgi:hypothetical protein
MSKSRDNLGVKQDMFPRASIFSRVKAGLCARVRARIKAEASAGGRAKERVRAGVKTGIPVKTRTKLRAAWVGFCLGLGGFCLLSSLTQPQIQAQSQPVISQMQLNQEISALFRSSASQELKKSGPASIRQIPSSRSAPSSMPMVKCATPLLRRAMRCQELLYTENKFILHRPTNPFDDDYYGRSVEVWSYDSSGGHFRIYYTEDTSGRNRNAVEDADGLKSTIPQYVLLFAQYFEQAWSYVIGTLGYHAPIAVGNKIEVFILDINGYGATAVDSQGLYIEVDNDYQGVSDNLDKEGKEFGAMKVTAVHEFFHVVQAWYDDWPDDFSDKNLWWEENSAVWIEDELYDEVDDYVHYLGQPYEDRNDDGRWELDEPHFTIYGNLISSSGRAGGWFDYPFISLNKTSYDADYSLFEYGGVIWVKFLSEHFGQKITKTIFERIHVQPSPDALMVIDAFDGFNEFKELDGSTDQSTEGTVRGTISFSDVFIQFKLANLLRSYDAYGTYEEGSKYPVPFHRNSYSTYPVSKKSASLDYLSCEYYAFKKPSTGQAIRIHFDFDSDIQIYSDVQAPFAVLAVPATSYQGSPLFGVAQLIPLAGGQQGGSFDFSFEQNPSYSKLVIIPINLSLTGIALYDLDAQIIDQNELPPAPQNIHYSINTRNGYPLVRLVWDNVIQDGEPDQNPISDSLQYQVQNQVRNSTQNPTQNPISDPIQYQVQNQVRNSTQNLTQNPISDPIQNPVQYQIWRCLRGGFLTMIFPSRQQKYNVRGNNEQGDNEQPYSDSNSFEDSDPDIKFGQTYLYQVKFINAAGSSSSEVIMVETNQETPLTVLPNHAPVFSPIDSDSKEIYEGESLKFTVSATDPDENTLTYSASGLPPGAVFNPDTEEFSWEPGSDQAGSYTVTFIATDNNVSTPLSGSVTVTITVNKILVGDNTAGCFITSCLQKFRCL